MDEQERVGRISATLQNFPGDDTGSLLRHRDSSAIMRGRSVVAAEAVVRHKDRCGVRRVLQLPNLHFGTDFD